MSDYDERQKDFRFRMRVRFHECDGQQVVFNARYGEYVDVAALEYSRAIANTLSVPQRDIDWRLVKQEMQWRSPARFDDIVDICVRTLAVGTSSFTWESHLYHIPSHTLLAQAETIYVLFDTERMAKKTIPDTLRDAMLAGACGVVTDCSGSLS